MIKRYYLVFSQKLGSSEIKWFCHLNGNTCRLFNPKDITSKEYIDPLGLIFVSFS